MNPIPPINDDPTWRQLLEYLDGSLPADDVSALNARLKADAELRVLFAELLTQQIKLKELAEEEALLHEDASQAAQPVPENVVQLRHQASDPARPVPAFWGAEPSQRIKRRVFSRRLSSLAAAAVLTLLGVVAWYGMQPNRLATLASLTGKVTIQRGDRLIVATAGTVLRTGDHLITDVNSQAGFDFLGEATEVKVAETSDVGLGRKNGSKELHLDRGSFQAAVAKQKPGRPLLLLTHQTEAVVVGTRFKLSTTGDATRLEVFEGAVSIMQSLEGPSLMVPAGTGVTVAPGKPVKVQRLSSVRGTLLFEQWSADDHATNQTYLSDFMFSGVGVQPGRSRARGYLHPPRSGAYSFHVNGDGPAELWFSETGDPRDVREVWTSANTNSPPFSAELRSDHRYYVELRRPSGGAFSLAWIPPNSPERVIYGQYLSPFDPGAPTAPR